MYKLCKTEQSAARQRELEQGLLAAMSTNLYEEISISDLCEQLEIPRKSFYRYFSGKDGALHALIDHTIMELESFRWPPVSENDQSFQLELEHFFAFWKERKLLLDALSRSGLSGVLIERSIEQALSEAGITRQHMSQHGPELRGHATMFGVCGLMSMVVTWHHDGYPHTPKQMAQIAVKLITEPLFSEIG